MTAIFSASSLSMSNGGRIVKVTLWWVCFSNSVAMAFAAICVEPTLSTRTSAAVARVDETMSVSVLTIVRKDGRMMSSRNAAVVIARTNLHPREAIRYSITSSARASSAAGTCRARALLSRDDDQFVLGRAPRLPTHQFLGGLFVVFEEFAVVIA